MASSARLYFGSSDVLQWLGTLDRHSAQNYIGYKLGPTVAQQLADTNDQGFGAAMMQITSTDATDTDEQLARPE